VWIFGRNRLSPLVHTLSICLASLGSIVSAFFILTANAWMQHPVGYHVVGHGAGRKAELTDFWAVLRNSTLWAEFSHTVLAAFVTGAMLMLGVSAWQLLRGRNVAAFTRTARLGAAVALVCVVLVIVTGDLQARLMDTQQPMKMAAAEAVYKTQSGASFSLLTIGNLSGQPIFQIRIPHLLSLIATLSWNGRVTGVTGAQRAEVAKYGPGSYVPVLWVTYWGFRIMVGLGFLILIMSAWALWRSRRGAAKPFQLGRWTLWALMACIASPFLANTAGWIFTEMGRQPWIVYGLLKTGVSASPTVSLADVAFTFGGFVLLYTVLGVIDVLLMYRSARRGLGPEEPHPPEGPGAPGEAPAEELIY
jgi:cytochrome d ubiquinol oxidase subunit I